MRRAAVLIGVSSTGGLPLLQAVGSGIEQMQAWAGTQGFATVTTLTDEAGPLAVAQIQDAIEEILEPGTVEQLVVYFAGHGVNIGGAEFWLLSRAPRRANEAVNVDLSDRLARRCAVPHIVMISDCCRTAAAAETIYQSITGTPIFPNVPPGPEERDVDRFYACALGAPSFEVKQTGADDYTAVYTATLAQALGGDPDSLLERADEAGVEFGLVRPRPLKKYLTDEVGRRLTRLTGSFDHSQTPTAVITSGGDAWLSRVEGRPAPTRGPGGAVEPVATPATRAGAAVRAALDDDAPPLSFGGGGDGSPGPLLPPGRALVVARGTTVRAESPTAAVTEALAGITVDLGGRSSTDLLMRFGNGTCALLPALSSFTTTTTVEGRDLVDVSWEGGAPQHWSRFPPPRTALSRAFAAAGRLGALNLDGYDVAALAERLRTDPLEPALAVQAAYALSDLHRDDLVAAIAERSALELGVDLFDLALLSGRRFLPRVPVAPAVPLCARGWALLGAVDLGLPEGVGGLRRHLLPSLWTLFDDAATPDVHDVMLATGRIR